MKKLLTVSLIAMMAVSAARADIASTGFVTDKTGDIATLSTTNKSSLTAAVNEVAGIAGAAAKASDLTALQGTVTTLSGTVGTNKATADKTQEDLDALEATVEGIDAAYKAADTTLTKKLGDLGDQTVKAYVDTKTADIATSDTVTALDTRVTTAEGEIDDLQASLAEGGATADAIAAAKKAGDDAQADLDAYKESNGTALAGVKATAEAALPTADFNSFKTENTNAIATAKSEAIADAASKYQVKALVTSQTEMNAAANKAAVYPSASLMESFVNDKTTGLVTGLGDVDSLETTAENVVGAINEVKDTADSALSKANAAVVANAAITAGTGSVITYDAKGLVTSGRALQASDIPTIGAAKVSGLASVATSGSYNDLSNKPAINNATLTIKNGATGSNLATFTANASSGATATIPAATAEVAGLARYGQIPSGGETSPTYATIWVE